jgi:hypothetical protein
MESLILLYECPFESFLGAYVVRKDIVLSGAR